MIEPWRELTLAGPVPWVWLGAVLAAAGVVVLVAYGVLVEWELHPARPRPPSLPGWAWWPPAGAAALVGFGAITSWAPPAPQTALETALVVPTLVTIVLLVWAALACYTRPRRVQAVAGVLAGAWCVPAAVTVVFASADAKAQWVYRSYQAADWVIGGPVTEGVGPYLTLAAGLVAWTWAVWLTLLLHPRR